MRNDTARARLAGAAIGVGTLVSVTLGSFGPAADAVTEPPPPTITVTPNPVAQGSEVLITVGNCATEPRLHGRGINTGMPALYEIEATPNGDLWTATFTPDRTHDLWIVAECEGAPLATILLDAGGQDERRYLDPLLPLVADDRSVTDALLDGWSPDQPDALASLMARCEF